jgi:hypothetical protein
MPAHFLPRLLLAVLGGAVPGAAETPHLVLQITVDQLRGDMLPRHRDRFGPGGFRRLLDQGIVFTDAHHAAANTLTASGHAVLVTGAATAAHGIVANDWHDPASGRSVYCVEDERFPLVGGPGRGRSPHRLTSSTLGDEIVAGSGGRARAFAVAAKDRAAIIPAGRSGRALWLSDATGGFVSSTFYYQDGLPAWVEEWNARRVFTRYRDAVWRPLRPGTAIEAEADPANPHARFPAELRRVFPHPLTARSDAVLLASLAYTPFSDELVAEFAATLLEREGLGHADFPDYLSVSFSATDYIGHAWGPESAEYVDNLARLDATLTRLFEAADRAVGAGRWLVVLSADHGVDDIPESRLAAGRPAGRFNPAALLAAANAALRTELRVETDFIAAFVPPGFYLAHERVRAVGLDSAVVAERLAAHLRGQPGVMAAYPRARILRNEGLDPSIAARVRRATHPERSGDVVLVQAPHWYLYPDAEGYAAMHGSPHHYDTHVALVLAGPGLRPAVVADPVDPGGIAPTVAALLGVQPPSGCSAPVLPGVLPPQQSGRR